MDFKRVRRAYVSHRALERSYTRERTMRVTLSGLMRHINLNLATNQRTYFPHTRSSFIHIHCPHIPQGTHICRRTRPDTHLQPGRSPHTCGQAAQSKLAMERASSITGLGACTTCKGTRCSSHEHTPHHGAAPAQPMSSGPIRGLTPDPRMGPA